MKTLMVVVVVALVALAGGATAQQQCGGWQQRPPPQCGACGLGQSMTSPCAELLRQRCPVASPAASPWWPQPQPQPPQCQLLRQQCCAQLQQTEPHLRCQAICGVVQAVVQQLQLQQQQMMPPQQPMMQPQQQPQGFYDPSSSPMMQPPMMAPQIGVGGWGGVQSSPMAVAQMAQSLPAMCGLYPVPSACTIPCAVAAVQPPVAATGGCY
ncbi:hypothetical protein ACP4OV_016078 [Aristida adscensionis]